jgi:D-xylose transport system permease protein
MTRAPVPDPTATAEAIELSIPPEVVPRALGEYLRGWTGRLWSGESRVLPVVAGLMLITLLFQVISPNHVFLSAGNLVNLFQQSAVFMVLAMAEGFVLLLGEIDLSVGYVAAVGGVIGVQLVQTSTTKWPWWAAIIAALLVCALIGALQGTLVARIKLPSFVVTLAGLLIFNGLMLLLLLLGPFSGYPSLAGKGNNLHVLYDLMWGTIDPVTSWITTAVIVAGLGLMVWLRDGSQRRSGLVAPPLGVTIMKIAAMAVIAIAVVAVCNVNRGSAGIVDGVPWIIPIVLAVAGVWSVLLQRTRFGRHVYAIGGSAEAARRAGIDVALVRTMAFTLCSLTAGIGGLLYASYLGGMSNNVNGGQLVLYAVAAAVIGGTSLFGGRGKVMDGVLGGLVIGGIYNGMYLLGLNVEWQFIVTGFVLLAAIAIDTLSRRGAT